ncbi:ABC transporter permease [Aestuariivirga sp.]|uniref:ABC transporter permease n=1 Tax=Aestuariivirga sp. TaxID=2650926 RepID=UPI003918DBD2
MPASVTLAVRRERILMRIGTSLAIVLGFLGIMLMYGPVAWLGLMSLSARPLTGKPGPLTLVWYEKLFADLRWIDPLLNSLGIAAIVSLLCMVAATLVGRVIPHIGRAGNWLLLLFLVVLFVPGVMLGIDFIMFYRLFLGIRTGLWSLVLAHFVWAFPFALLSVLVVAARFDVRLLEVAADLGADGWRRFRDIEMPLLFPGIVSAGFFGFLLSLNELPRSIYLRGGITTLPLFQWAEASSHTTMVPLIYSLSTLITLASLMLTVFSLRLLFKREAQ